MLKKVSVTDLKRNLHALFKELKNGKYSGLLVTRYKIPVAVIVSWEKCEQLKKRLGLPLSKNEEKMLKKSEKDATDGRLKKLL